MNVIERFHSGTCAETREALSAHLEGDLRGLRRRRVLAHLSRCERCQAVLASLRRTVEHLRALGRLDPVPSPAVADAVLDRIRRGDLGADGR